MSTSPLILVVGTDSEIRDDLVRLLDEEHYQVAGAPAPEDAISHLDDPVSLVIGELQSGDFSGLDLLRLWKSRQPQTAFVLIAEGDDVRSAVEAMKLGAADCLVKPVEPDQIRTRVRELLKTNGGGEHRRSQRTGEPSEETRDKSRIDIPPGTSLEDLERAAVEQALAQHHGNRTHAAKTLGISVRTLQRKLKAWGIPVVGSQNAQHQNRSPHFLVSSHNTPSSYSAHVH